MLLLASKSLERPALKLILLDDDIISIKDLVPGNLHDQVLRLPIVFYANHVK